MISKPSCMADGRNETAAQGIHFCKGADHSRITEVVSIHPSGKARAGCRLHRNDAVVPFTPELLPHKRRNQASQIGSSPGTADNDVGLHAVFVQGSLCLQADNRLVQKHLVQHTAQYIAVALPVLFRLHSLGDGAAQASGGAGMLSQNLPAHFGGHAGGGGDGGPVGAHHFPAERLLLIGDFYHVYQAVQVKIGTGHGQSGAPLAGAGLGGDALKSLLFGIISLGNG